MKNVLKCDNCGNENPIYQLTCSQCKSYLRARIVNLDFWDTLWKMLYSPVNTAKDIIQAENKNYIATCAFIALIKFSLISYMLMNATGISGETNHTFLNGFLSGGIPFLVTVVLFSLLITFLNSKLGVKGRIKDAISVYFFSFTPVILALLILAPIQIALFGEYWFTFNPSPFIMKPQAALVIFLIELLMYLWSGLLFVTSTYAQTKNLIYSLVTGSIGFLALAAVIYYFASAMN